MGKLDIVDIPVTDIKPYRKNNRKHNKKQVANIAQSITDFDFTQPIVVDKDNTVIIGHGRLQAAKALNMETVPCIIRDDLDEEQVRKLRILDNKLNEESEVDIDNLLDELEDIKFPDYDLEFDLPTKEEREIQHEEWAEKTQEAVESILNLQKGQYDGSGNKYDFPEIAPVYELPPIREWIRFKDVLSDKDPEGKAVHFFIDDYQFERLWNNPEKYIDKLRQYVCVASPDFSPYGDMPLIAQMWNHYRKHWCAVYMQEHGITVIPTLRLSSDPRSMEWWLMGEPKNSIVMMSGMWASIEDEEYQQIGADSWTMMQEQLHPKKIIVYGRPEQIELKDGDLYPDQEIEFVEQFARKMWGG